MVSKSQTLTVLIEFTSGPVRFGLVWYGFVLRCRCRFFGRSFFWRLERERETDRQTDRDTETHRDRDRETDRKREMERETDREIERER